MGLSRVTIQRIWVQHNLQPHHVQTIKLSSPDRAAASLVSEIPARQMHDYKPNGTMTLFAALSMLDGKVIGTCLPRHRKKEIPQILNQIDRETEKELDLHLIAENYGTHKSPTVRRWFKRHPWFHFHYIPSSSSWLKLVERWFGEITRKHIRRGTFPSAQALITALNEHLAEYNQHPTPFVWTKDADMTQDKVQHCKDALGTKH